MTFVLDAGAFLAVERGDRELAALLIAETRAGTPPITHGGVVAQVWRGGARQALVSRLLRSVEVVSIGKALGQQTGQLLGASGTSDAIDAAVVGITSDGDTILTSDPHDLAHLVAADGVNAGVFRV